MQAEPQRQLMRLDIAYTIPVIQGGWKNSRHGLESPIVIDQIIDRPGNVRRMHSPSYPQLVVSSGDIERKYLLSFADIVNLRRRGEGLFASMTPEVKDRLKSLGYGDRDIQHFINHFKTRWGVQIIESKEEDIKTRGDHEGDVASKGQEALQIPAGYREISEEAKHLADLLYLSPDSEGKDYVGRLPIFPRLFARAGVKEREALEEIICGVLTPYLDLKGGRELIFNWVPDDPYWSTKPDIPFVKRRLLHFNTPNWLQIAADDSDLHYGPYKIEKINEGRVEHIIVPYGYYPLSKGYSDQERQFYDSHLMWFLGLGDKEKGAVELSFGR